MKKNRALLIAAVLIGATLACSFIGASDPGLNSEEASIVASGVSVVQTEQAAIGTLALEVAEPLPTFTVSASESDVQSPSTETPLPEVAAQATNTQPPSPTSPPELWDGTWETDCYYAPGCSQVILEQTGEYVTGTYRDGVGTIEGTAIGNHLVGVWMVGNDIGTIDFWLDDSGTRWAGNFNGSYFWCGAREGLLFPRPCGIATFYGVWDMPCIGDDCQMVVTQNGAEVNGYYPNGGILSGTVSNTHFQGTWEREGNSGSLDFWIMPGGKSWQGNADTTQGWCGFRDINNFQGTCGITSWYGTWISQCGNSNCGELIINQIGDSVTGTYADGDGAISGTISGDELTGTWARNNSSGPFHFYLNDNGYQFQGNFNSNFPWCGYLEGQSPPAVCYQQ